MTEYIMTEVTAIDIIEQLNAYLAVYGREVTELRSIIAERDRKIENLLRFIDSFEKQRERPH